MFFNDGWWYLDPAGDVRGAVVLDNLAASGELPPMIGVFVDPGVRDVDGAPSKNRIATSTGTPETTTGSRRISRPLPRLPARAMTSASSSAMEGTARITVVCSSPTRCAGSGRCKDRIMDASSRTLQVRMADLSGPDAAAVGFLVEAYLIQTEGEKEAHLGEPSARHGLPERYRDEVAHPARAYAGATVLLAELDGVCVGVAVVQRLVAANELKRLWVDPSARGLRVGSALIDTALSAHGRPVRLTVWDWRVDAITLYRKRGFVEVPSWDERERLLCFEVTQVL